MTTGRNPLESWSSILHHGELVFADAVLWPGLRESNGLSHHLEELQGNARPFAQLAERRFAE
jgi:hypothetical protein